MKPRVKIAQPLVGQDANNYTNTLEDNRTDRSIDGPLKNAGRVQIMLKMTSYQCKAYYRAARHVTNYLKGFSIIGASHITLTS